MANNVTSKIVIKNETFNDWSKSEYTPKEGELVAILKDANNESNPYGIVIGDGTNEVRKLPILGIEHSLIKQYNTIDDLINIKDEEHLGYLNSNETLFDENDKPIGTPIGLFYYGYPHVVFDDESGLVLDSDGNKDSRNKYFYFFNAKKVVSKFEENGVTADGVTTKYKTYIVSDVEFKDKITALEEALLGESKVRKKSIEDEEERALEAEAKLRADLNSEIGRSTRVDEELDDKIDAETKRASDAEGSIESALGEEVSRSKTRDSEHDTKIDANSNAIITESGERKTYDNYLYGEAFEGAPEHTILSNYRSLNDIRIRVDEAEDKIDAITNVMDFVGAFETKPDVANYNDGDVIVITSGEDAGKEFVLCDGNWVELGDTSAEQAAISQLQSSVEEINSEISIVKEDIKTNYVTNTKLTEELNKFEFDVNIDCGTQEDLNKIENPQEGDIFLVEGESGGGSYPDFDGTITMEQVTGNLPTDRLEGTIPATMIDGELTEKQMPESVNNVVENAVLKPTTANPLDNRIYFESYNEALTAASTAVNVGESGTYYIGMKLLVKEDEVYNWYIIDSNCNLVLENIVEVKLDEETKIELVNQILDESRFTNVTTWKDLKDLVSLGYASQRLKTGTCILTSHNTFGQLPWKIVGIDQEDVYDSEGNRKHSITLQLDGCMVGAFQFNKGIRDASIQKTYHKKYYGDNNYRNSAIRQWLNSSETKGNWWSGDADGENTGHQKPEYATTLDGFLYGLDEEFLSIITAVPKTFVVDENDTLDTVTDKFFLPSITEINGGLNKIPYGYIKGYDAMTDGVSEGVCYSYYGSARGAHRGVDSNRCLTGINSDDSYTWATRSIAHITKENACDLSNIFYVDKNGTMYWAGADYNHGISPMCCIVED
jgi:hypothetical protein